MYSSNEDRITLGNLLIKALNTSHQELIELAMIYCLESPTDTEKRDYMRQYKAVQHIFKQWSFGMPRVKVFDIPEESKIFKIAANDKMKPRKTA